MQRVLILCSQNTARSQMAQAYFQFYANGQAIFESAGLTSGKVHPQAIAVMEEDNIDLAHHTSKSIHELDEEPWDLLITVCENARQLLPADLVYRRHIHFPGIQNPAACTGPPEEIRQCFQMVREMLKKEVLRLVGQEFQSALSVA